MPKHLCIFSFSLFFCTACTSQAQLNQFKITSSHTSFPDTGRTNGHSYNNIFYDAPAHYSDSTVIIITPKNFIKSKKVNMIFWFHGWNNNIDSALIRYGLARQFAESGVNAVLVFAETGKDVPDSYGGKLEQPNTFSDLVKDVLIKLVGVNALSSRDAVGNIILAGHSGAYRVMANILKNGGLPVQEVILFDALYANTDNFLNWLTSSNNHRFINLYTNDGGTFDETKNMMNRVRDLNIAADSLEETQVTPRILRENKILFIHTVHAHNDIIQNPDNFKLYLQNNPFLSK